MKTHTTFRTSRFILIVFVALEVGFIIGQYYTKHLFVEALKEIVINQP